jgi:uncharacterized membrane protein (DUF4010 family)
MVILPVLPDKDYGPFGAWNPHEIWFMVVLIVGISIIGYAVYKFFGQQAGTFVGGLLGGLVSSTATTVSFARRVGQEPHAVGMTAIVMVIASTVAMGRVIAEVALAAPPTFWQLAPPLLAMLAWMIVLSCAVYWFYRDDKTHFPPPRNPAELKTALAFGALYAIVKLAVAASHHYFGRSALFGVAGLSGLTDMDAITLSTAKLVEGQQLPSDLGWQIILFAALANLAFKGGIAVILGQRQFALRAIAIFGSAIVGSALILWLWPTQT